MNVREQFNKICKTHNILSAYIFGSMSKKGAAILDGKKPKKTDPIADVDIGVVFLERLSDPKERIKIYGRLYSKLSDIFLPFKLDLVFLQETGIIIQFEAINGILVYNHDEDMSLDYEERVIKFYQDWKPDYDQYTREILEAITT